jgi:hypothetical protein
MLGPWSPSKETDQASAAREARTAKSLDALGKSQTDMQLRTQARLLGLIRSKAPERPSRSPSLDRKGGVHRHETSADRTLHSQIVAMSKRCKEVFQNHRSYGANHEERTQLAERSGRSATIAESAENHLPMGDFGR